MADRPERLSPETRELLISPENELWVSSIIPAEIAIKHAIGKLMLDQPPAEYVRMRMTRDQFVALDLIHNHALAVADLPMHHRDPFDRLLIAQSRVEGVPIITADPKLRAYDVDVVFAV